MPFYVGKTSQLSADVEDIVSARLSQHIATTRFGTSTEYTAEVLDGEVQGGFQSSAVENLVTDMLGTRVGWPGNVARPMSETKFAQLGKDSAMTFFKENPEAGNQVGSMIRDVANGVARAPLAQSEQAFDAEDAIVTGELDFPGFWGVAGELPPPEEEAPLKTTHSATESRSKVAQDVSHVR